MIYSYNITKYNNIGGKMKLDWNKKYTTIAMYSFIVIALSIVFYQILSKLEAVSVQVGWIMSILQPFIIGFIIAYLLNFILVLIEKNFNKVESYKKLGKKSKRGISILLTYMAAIFLMYLFMSFVFPQLVDSISGLVEDIPSYVANASKLAEEIGKNIQVDSQYLDMALEEWNELTAKITGIITDLIPKIGTFIQSAASSIWNIVIGIVISVYMLIDKENFFALGKKISYALLPKQNADRVIELTRRTNTTFSKFLSGKIIDSTIIGILTFAILIVFDMPYAILVSIIIGITNIIPFFGPFIGAVPAVIIIMFVSPVKALWFILIIFIIQQLDGNVIGPKILGDSIGISAFWILFSILVAGELLGIAGMIIGVPLFAVVYSVIKEKAEESLVKKGLPVDTDSYKDDK